MRVLWRFAMCNKHGISPKYGGTLFPQKPSRSKFTGGSSNPRCLNRHTIIVPKLTQFSLKERKKLGGHQSLNQPNDRGRHCLLSYCMSNYLRHAIFLQQSQIKSGFGFRALVRPAKLVSEPYHGQGHVCRSDSLPDFFAQMGGKHTAATSRLHAKDGSKGATTRW